MLSLVAWDVQNLALKLATVAFRPRWPPSRCSFLIMSSVSGWSYGSNTWGSFSGVNGLSSETRVPTTQHRSFITGRRPRKRLQTDLAVHPRWTSTINILSASLSISGVTLERTPPLKERAWNMPRIRAKAHFTTDTEEHRPEDAYQWLPTWALLAAWVSTSFS